MRTVPDPAVPEVAAHLRLVLTRTARALRRETPGGLGPSKGGALATIEAHGPLTPSEVAVREGIQRPSVTRIVAALEQDGLVEREADPDDGRSFLVRVTPAGADHLTEVRSRRDAVMARWLGSLEADERQILDHAATILERLLAEDASVDPPR